MTLQGIEQQKGEPAYGRSAGLGFGALTWSIVHEVNQPLTGVITNASTCLRMLDADPFDAVGAREAARLALRDGWRAAHVIQWLRALFAEQPTETEVVDLNDAAREVIASFRAELQRSGVAIQTELANDLPPVDGNRVQLEQVILNLVLNARDAAAGVAPSPSSRRVVLRTACDDGDGVTLSVEDAGAGLDVQNLDRLFQPGFTTKRDGMGIGLFVSRAIIEHHHGSLHARQNDGPGATFFFSLPSAPRAGIHPDRPPIACPDHLEG